jgi:mono/diheme cytochrome c family protein
MGPVHRTFALAALLVAVLTLAQALPVRAGGRAGTSYTKAQAAAGAKAYATSCASCHGARLEGVTAPPLQGAAAPFHATETVGDVYAFTTTQMPLGKPASLSPTTYTAILAYLMQKNGHPAGPRPLTPATAAHSTQKM